MLSIQTSWLEGTVYTLRGNYPSGRREFKEDCHRDGSTVVGQYSSVYPQASASVGICLGVFIGVAILCGSDSILVYVFSLQSAGSKAQLGTYKNLCYHNMANYQRGRQSPLQAGEIEIINVRE